jgi:hypothetical protein
MNIPVRQPRIFSKGRMDGSMNPVGWNGKLLNFKKVDECIAAI